jgi:osmotically-inducible protein OsmY
MAIPSRTDEQIQRDVLDELRWHPRVEATDVGVSVKDGVVILTGWLDSFVKRAAAEEAALRVRGVNAVANDIIVRLSSTAERTDADIAAAATLALEWDAVVPIDQIDLTVSQGWITLRGEVEWHHQREDADRVVRRLSGVRGVTNEIRMRPRTISSPTALKEHIENALVRRARVDAHRITVETTAAGGRVILRGAVSSWAERHEAESTAWLAPGIESVDNQINISG